MMQNQGWVWVYLPLFVYIFVSLFIIIFFFIYLPIIFIIFFVYIISHNFGLKTIIVLTFSQSVNLSQNNTSMQNPPTSKQLPLKYVMFITDPA